jgi:cardiolipin synthase
MEAVSKEIWTIPNMITMSRIVASPGLTYAIACDMKGVALGGCVFFGFTDWLDGYVAKRYNMKSILGGFLDPMADKIFIGALTIGLAMKGLFPLSLAATIIGRDVVLVAASFAMRAMERPTGAPFFDTTNSATFQIVPSELSKVNTVCQIALLVLSLGSFACDTPSIAQIEPLYWITGVTTVGSGLGYLDGTGIKRIGKSGEYRNISKTSTVTADAVEKKENK